MTNKTYNGWTNYETCLVNLHLTNDQGDYEFVRNATETEFFEYMENQFEDVCDTLPSMLSDLLRAAWDEVNLSEIYQTFQEEK